MCGCESGVDTRNRLSTATRHLWPSFYAKVQSNLVSLYPTYRRIWIAELYHDSEAILQTAHIY